MRLWVLAAWAAVSAAAAVDGCRAVDDRFYDCVHADGAYTLHAPAGGTRGAAVILLLHGAGRNRLTLWQDERTRAALRSSRAVIVMPDGGGSWWLGRAGAWPDELLDWLAPKLGLSDRRAACGWSMGGYGSLSLVERRPERYAAWGGLLALADFPNPALPPDQNHAVPAVFGSPAGWPALNPMEKAAALRGKAVFLLTTAEAFDRTMNRNFHARLQALGIAHEYVEAEGGHRFDVVAAHLGRMLDFLDRALEEMR